MLMVSRHNIAGPTCSTLNQDYNSKPDHQEFAYGSTIVSNESVSDRVGQDQLVQNSHLKVK